MALADALFTFHLRLPCLLASASQSKCKIDCSNLASNIHNPNEMHNTPGAALHVNEPGPTRLYMYVHTCEMALIYTHMYICLALHVTQVCVGILVFV